MSTEFIFMRHTIAMYKDYKYNVKKERVGGGGMTKTWASKSYIVINYYNSDDLCSQLHAFQILSLHWMLYDWQQQHLNLSLDQHTHTKSHNQQPCTMLAQFQMDYHNNLHFSNEHIFIGLEGNVLCVILPCCQQVI